MRHKHLAAGAAVAALGFLAAACGAADGTGVSSGGDAVQSPAKAAVASPSPAAPSAMVAGQVGALGQAGPDAGLVLGRPEMLRQEQLLQQGDVAAVAAQAATSASDPAALVCG
jgi:hypothetical protein